MVAEVFAGIGAFKAMLDMAKGLKDINDASIRNGAVIELQEKILSAHQAQLTLLDRISELEKEVARFETWDAEKEKYELKNVVWGAVAYMLKPEVRGTEPPHWLCTNCYENRRKSIMQAGPGAGRGSAYKCPACPNTFSADSEPCWLPEHA